MKNLSFLALLLLTVNCGGSANESEDEPVKSVCQAFGEAPEITTVRTPKGSVPPVDSCVKLDEPSPLGQDVYCCLSSDFN